MEPPLPSMDAVEDEKMNVEQQVAPVDEQQTAPEGCVQLLPKIKKKATLLLSFNPIFSLVFFNLSSHCADRGKKRKQIIWKRRGGRNSRREKVGR